MINLYSITQMVNTEGADGQWKNNSLISAYGLY